MEVWLAGFRRTRGRTNGRVARMIQTTAFPTVRFSVSLPLGDYEERGDRVLS